MIAGLLGFVLFYFASPFLVVFMAFKLFAEVAAWFGIWFAPAIFALWIGLLLLLVGPSDPNMDVMTLQQAIAESHIAGLSTPFALITFSIICLSCGAAFKILRNRD